MNRKWHLFVQSVLVSAQVINAGIAWQHQGVVGVIISGVQAGLAFYVHGLDTEGNKL